MEEERALRDLVRLRTRGSHSKLISHLSGSLEFSFGQLDRATGMPCQFKLLHSCLFELPRKMGMEEINSFLS